MQQMERQLVVSAIVSFLLLAVMLAAFSTYSWSSIGSAIAGTSDIAVQMFEPSGYGLTPLIVGVLLGASMVGGVYLAKEE